MSNETMEEKLFSLNQLYGEAYAEIGKLTFTEIAKKFLGDEHEKTFFIAGEALSNVILGDQENAPTMVMSLLSGLIQRAWLKGRESATQ